MPECGEYNTSRRAAPCACGCAVSRIFMSTLSRGLESPRYGRASRFLLRAFHPRYPMIDGLPGSHLARTEPAAARGRDRRRGAGADLGGARLRQDARHRPPHRLSGRCRRRRAVAHPRRHVHEQGGEGDARPRRRASGRRRERRRARHVPLTLRALPAHRWAPYRPRPVVQYLRCRRPDGGDQARRRGARCRYEAHQGARHPFDDLAREERADLVVRLRLDDARLVHRGRRALL